MTPPVPSLEVEYAGCKRVTRGPECEVTPGAALTLWMPVTFRGLQLKLGEQVINVEEKVVVGGHQAVVEVQPGLLQLMENGNPRFQLRLVTARSNPVLDEAEHLKNSGEYERALQLSNQVTGLSSTSTIERLLAQGVAARVYLRTGRTDEAVAMLSQTAGALFELGQVSDATRDVFALVYLYGILDQLEAARHWFERWRAEISVYPEGRALIRDHEAMLARLSGDLPAAAALWRISARMYERIGLSARESGATTEEIDTLALLGQVKEAYQRKLQQSVPPDARACARAEFYISLSFLSVLRSEDGERDSDANVPAQLADARRWASRCAEPKNIVNAAINRGLWALLEGDLNEARRANAELSQQPPTREPQLTAWVFEFAARLALAERRYVDARKQLLREQLVGQHAGHLDPQIRALIGLAQVEQAAGKKNQAKRWLENAMALLDRAQRMAPLGPIAHTQFAARQRAARRLVALWLEQGEPARAYQVALVSYRTALALQSRPAAIVGLDLATRQQWTALVSEFQRRRTEIDREIEDDWKRTVAQQKAADTRRTKQLEELEQLITRAGLLYASAESEPALPRPEDDDLWLLMFPLETGWAAFVTTRAGTTAATFGKLEGDPLQGQAMTHPVLAPFEAALTQAPRIVLLPAGASKGWPFERWKLGGIPLAARNLAFSSGLASAGKARPRGLPTAPGVVMNPAGDLPFAGEEGQLVGKSLNVPASQVLSGDRATASAVLNLLESSDYFHFAGHAGSSSSHDGAALLLARQTQLQPWELYGLRSVPSRVVLSACYAGQSSDSVGPGWGVAQALLALGSDSVIAPLDAVNDRDALEVQRSFYRELANGTDFREAFWAVERRLARNASSKGSGLRLYVR